MHRYVHPVVVAVLLWFGAAVSPTSALAAEIKIFSSPGVRGIVSEISRQFETQTGSKVIIDFAVFAALNRRIEAGDPFDVAILSPELADVWIKRGRIAADTRRTLGRAGTAVAVRKGDLKPDISTVEAFKRTMLNARSVAYSSEGTGGKSFLAALERLGIAAEMKSKLRGYDGNSTALAVVNGEAEIAITGFGNILAEPRAELVGGLPGDLQTYVVYTIGVSAQSKQPEISRSLVRFLTAPGAVPVMKANGLEPGD